MLLDWIQSKLLPGKAQRLLREAQDAYRAGAPERARQRCLEILRGSPNDLQALCLMAAMAADARQTGDGLQWAQRALAAAPRAAAAHYAMGRVQEAAARYAEAESSYREAIRLDAGHARAWNNLGCVLHMQGRLDAALDGYRKALELDASQPEANQNYAAIVRDEAAQALAIQGYLRQTAENPHDAAAFNNLANTYAELGRQAEALASFERAIALDPQRAEAHFGKATLLLLRGDYAQGWQEYEWRWRLSAFSEAARRFPQPMWDGSRIAGGTILMCAEQGFGDTLQFVRYAPRVAERCAAVVLECQPQLKALLQDVAGVQRVVARGEALPRFAAHVYLMSLPRIFGTTPDTIPWQGPYVHADPQRAEQWRPLIEPRAAARLRVGLIWAGNPQQWGDRSRSMSLAMLAPLARAAGVAFYSVQKGEAGAQAAAPPAGMKLADLTGRIRDFSDTAALLSHLDLVISIDTSVAHLAGAMGVPAWVLLSRAPHWPYQLERGDHPWYPAMRLFRQQRDGDWSEVVERVARELMRLSLRG